MAAPVVPQLAVPSLAPQVSAPAPVTMANRWNIGADPGAIRATAQAWRSLCDAAHKAVGGVDKPASTVRKSWKGEASDSYDRHHQRLNRDLNGFADLTGSVAGRLDDIAGRLEQAQHTLDGLLGQARQACPVDINSQSVTFHPPTPEVANQIAGFAAAADQERAAAEGDLQREIDSLRPLRDQFSAMGATWAAQARGDVDGFLVPAETGKNMTIVKDGDKVLVDTGSGDDRVLVTVDPETGKVGVVVNGHSTIFPKGTKLTLHTGSGQDTVYMPPEDNGSITVVAGSGDDIVTTGGGADTVLGGSGNDTVDTGGGDDWVAGGSGFDYLYGADGNDTMFGGAGTDTVIGGAGDDFLHGGSDNDFVNGAGGNDVVAGGSGDDAVAGGSGDDTVFGGAGNDALYSGQGSDTLDVGSGANQAYADGANTAMPVIGHDTVLGPNAAAQTVNIAINGDSGNFIRIEPAAGGQPDFQARAQEELDFLRSSPHGQQMLAALDILHRDHGTSLTISEVQGGENISADPGPVTTGPAQDVISWDPTFIGDNVHVPVLPPAGVLDHEMGHVYDFGNHSEAPGNTVEMGPQGPMNIPNTEREVVGLPVDADGNPVTPPQLWPGHPTPLTENALREEIHAALRTKYGSA
ncbi:MAG: M91 family zinc metallopeptidase [Actinomycetota bacterium]|nr:M91 family zinc metallopeptidase [Actinomycetota bacterium]